MITADRTIIKYVLSLLILISGLFVVSVPVNAGPVKPVSVSMGASVGSQVIFYDNYNPTSRHTIGGGVNLHYDRIIKENLAAKLSAGIEYFNYPGFHRYLDLKTKAGIMSLIANCNIADKPSTLYFTAGAGCDFVFRDDNDFGGYFLGAAGLQLNVKESENLDLVLATDAEVSFQNGSRVIHISTGVKIACNFNKADGGDNR